MYHQVTAQLLALDRLASRPVMSISTDLADSWTFFWLGLCPSSHGERRRVFSMKVTGLKLGIFTLKRVLSGKCNPPSAQELCQTCGST